jgi:hypothetical protein
MRKYILLFACLSLSLLGANAQRSREEIKANPNLAANNYRDYPVPTAKLTPAPKGYEPFYISHYGRHGSRWLIGKNAFNKPYYTLAHADSLGKLTERGKEVFTLVKTMRQQGMSREGELTQLGAEQHRGIAKRMYERFPQVFAEQTHVDAHSTVVIRCILSMENELLQLAALNPKISFSSDASYHDMYYMNDNDTSPYAPMIRTTAAIDSLEAFEKRHSDVPFMMKTIFNDADYAKSLNNRSLARQLFNIAIALQNTELRHQFKPIWDIFSSDELYNQWLMTTAYWYSVAGPNKLNNGAGMYTQLNLVKNILETADSCVALPHPGATLRFAHESDVLPLVCLLNINGFGNPRSSLEKLDDEDWDVYNVFPMACNVQFVFYKDQKKPSKDILVKVLLNENEATLPIKAYTGPYYKWKDVRAYMMKILGKRIEH